MISTACVRVGLQAFLKFGVLETCEGIFEEGTDNMYFAYNDLLISLFIVSLRCIKSADMDSTGRT